MSARNRVDLDDVDRRFLQQCGPCDVGVLAACTCPTEDYRPVMHALVEELRRTRRELDNATGACGRQLAAELRHVRERANDNALRRTLAELFLRSLGDRIVDRIEDVHARSQGEQRGAYAVALGIARDVTERHVAGDPHGLDPLVFKREVTTS